MSFDDLQYNGRGGGAFNCTLNNSVLTDNWADRGSAYLGTLISAVQLACAQPLQPGVLVSFNGTDGAFPNALVFGGDGNLYGTTFWGGDFDYGILFRATTLLLTTRSLISFRHSGGQGFGGAEFRPLPGDRPGVRLAHHRGQ